MIDANEFLKIKKLALISLVSDDILMDKLVLKGGTCLELAYKIHCRSSKDIDFSINNEFTDAEIMQIKRDLPEIFNKNFSEIGYYAFDFRIKNKPVHMPIDIKMTGYNLSFKLVSNDVHNEFKDNIDKLRNRALSLGQSDKKDFVIDISKFEYTQNKEEKEIDGHKIYVYPPVMIICEKLRAICQKMKEYRNNLGDTDLPRARDFWDIYLVQENLPKVDFKLQENRDILKHVFDAKDVDIGCVSVTRSAVHKYSPFGV